MPVNIPGDREDALGEEYPRVAQDADVREREDSRDFLPCVRVRQVSAERESIKVSGCVWYGLTMGVALTHC